MKVFQCSGGGLAYQLNAQTARRLDIGHVHWDSALFEGKGLPGETVTFGAVGTSRSFRFAGRGRVSNRRLPKKKKTTN